VENRQERVYGAVRTALIGYGTAAFAFLEPVSLSGAAPQAPGLLGNPRAVVLLGVGLQLLLMIARTLIKRHAPDWAESGRSMLILETVADGVTVLLFAAATLGPITFGAADL
jgi:hypothetical protein